MLWGFTLVVVILGIVFFNMAINLLVFPRVLPQKLPETGPTIWPKISILVPARNEEANIRRCVGTLLAQTYPEFELVVLDDASSDSTRRILEEIRSTHPRGGRLTILEGKPPPDGWLGKCWACEQLAQTATGEWLLFTDADTRHHPDGVTAALLLAEERRADLLSLWPRQITETVAEQLAVPMVQLILIGYCPLWLLNVVRSPRMTAACGQFMLWRNSAYRTVGGHAAVASHAVEDVALGGLTLRHGLRLVNADGTETVSTRMYGGFRELWRGFSKNFYRGFGGHPFPFFLFLLVQTAPFLIPWVWLVGIFAELLAGVSGSLPSAHFGEMPVLTRYFAAFGTILLCFIIHGMPAVRFRQTGLSALAYPVSELILLAIGLNSFAQTVFGRGVLWKGRRIARA